MQTVEMDDKGVFRINPLAFWTRGQIAEATAGFGLPEHPLAAKGYKSIGCAPCTAPVAEGQDERAGRWAHTIGLDERQKAECGIHLPAGDMNWSV